MGHITIERSGLTGLSLVGELDLDTAPRLAREVAVMGASVRLDLSRCTFMDSTGISTLILLQKRLREEGGSLFLVEPSEAVARVLTICGLAEQFDIEPLPGGPT